MEKLKKNKIFIVSGIIVLALIIVIFMCTFISKINNKSNISIEINEIEYKNIGNNVYYTDELINKKAEDKENILNCYSKISDYIKKKYNSEIYINNFNYDNYDEEHNNIYFYGIQIKNNVLIPEIHFTITVKDNNVTELTFDNNKYPTFISREINTDNIISTEKIKEIATTLARKNSDAILGTHLSTMYTNDNKLYFYPNNSINGTIFLECDGKKNTPYYKVKLNKSSYIEIDAINGNIINEYYFDGKITN